MKIEKITTSQLLVLIGDSKADIAMIALAIDTLAFRINELINAHNESRETPEGTLVYSEEKDCMQEYRDGKWVKSEIQI